MLKTEIYFYQPNKIETEMIQYSIKSILIESVKTIARLNELKNYCSHYIEYIKDSYPKEWFSPLVLHSNSNDWNSEEARVSFISTFPFIQNVECSCPRMVNTMISMKGLNKEEKRIIKKIPKISERMYQEKNLKHQEKIVAHKRSREERNAYQRQYYHQHKDRYKMRYELRKQQERSHLKKIEEKFFSYLKNNYIEKNDGYYISITKMRKEMGYKITNIIVKKYRLKTEPGKLTKLTRRLVEVIDKGMV